MRRVLARRLLGAVVQILIVTLFAWFLFYVIAKVTGATPAQRIAGKNASRAQIELVTRLLGLNKPYWQQYLIFMNHLIHGNLGFSYVQERPVSAIIWPATRATGSLVIGAAVIWLLIAAPIGGYGGLRPRSIGDVVGRAAAIIGMSIPVFWLSPMIAYFLGYQPTQGELFGLPVLPVGTSIFPIQGYTDFGHEPAAVGLSPAAAVDHARDRLRRRLHQVHQDAHGRAARGGLRPDGAGERSEHQTGAPHPRRPQYRADDHRAARRRHRDRSHRSVLRGDGLRNSRAGLHRPFRH